MSLDLDAVRARHAAYRQSHDHPGAFACCTAHASADDVPTLLARLDDAITFTILDSRPDLPALQRTLTAVRRMMATSSRDWSLSKGDAWLYAILVGWNDDPEDPDYDATALSGLASIGQQHGWSLEGIAQLEAMHAAIIALDEAMA